MAFLHSSSARLAAGLGLLLTMSGAARAQAPSAFDQQVAAAERAQLDALKRGDLPAFGAMIAEDAVFVDSHGFATKAEVLQHVQDLRLASFTMEDMRFEQLTADSGLVAYRLTESGTSHGHAFEGRVNVSSIWKKRGGRWVCLFSQESPIPKPAAH